MKKAGKAMLVTSAQKLSTGRCAVSEQRQLLMVGLARDGALAAGQPSKTAAEVLVNSSVPDDSVPGE